MLRRPEPRRIGHRWARGLVAALILMSIPLAVFAAKKSYRYEDDPNRLGMKAIDEGRYEDAQKNFEEAIANEYQVYKAHYGLALIKSLQGGYADAEPLYRLALMEKNQETGSPDFPEAHASLGLDLLRLERPAEARQEFDIALREKGNVWEAQYGMARVLILDQKYDEAAKLLDKGSKKKGRLEGEDYYHYGMALVQRAQGDLPGAEKNALAALNLNPGDPDYGTLVGDIYTKRGARTLAIQEYEKALAQPGVRPSAMILHNLGFLYQQEAMANKDQTEFRKAIDNYREAAKLDSTYAPAWKDMGDILFMAKQYEDAAGAYLRYSGLRRDDPAGFLGFTESALKLRKFGKAAYESALQAFKIDSTNVRSRLLLARSAFQAKEKATAARLYATVADSTQFDANDWVTIGQLRLEDKKYDAAGPALWRAVKADSTLADGWFSLGLLNLTQSKPDSAEMRFRKATSLAPTNLSAWMNLGVALLQQKRSRDAIPVFREAVRLQPTNYAASVSLGNALFGADSINTAMAVYKEVREKDPKNLGAIRGLALCYFSRKENGQAARTMQEAVAIDPNNADNFMMLGQALAGNGDINGALKAIDEALRLNPNHEGAKKAREILLKAKKTAGGGK